MRNETQRQETATQIAAEAMVPYNDRITNPVDRVRIMNAAREAALISLRGNSYSIRAANREAEIVIIHDLLFNRYGPNGGSRESRIRKDKPRKTGRGTKRRRGNKRTQKRGRMQGGRITRQRKKKRRTTQKLR